MASHFTNSITIYPYITPFSNDSNDNIIFTMITMTSSFVQWYHHFSDDVKILLMMSSFFKWCHLFSNDVTFYPMASQFTYCITIFPRMTPSSNYSNDIFIFQRHQSHFWNDVIILPMMSWHHDIMTSSLFQCVIILPMM